MIAIGVLGLAWLLVLLVAFHQAGSRLLRALAPRFATDCGIAIVFGMAAFLAYCGLLEVTATAGRIPLVVPIAVFFAAGLPAALRGVRTALATPNRARAVTAATVLGIVGALLLGLFLLNASSWHYTNIDDLQGYLVFPERILTLGSSGRDPFLYRRLESGLTGGGSYFYALFRALFPSDQTRLADFGLGSVTLVMLVRGHARAVGLSSTSQSLLMLAALFAAVFAPVVNNTPDTLGKVALYALFRYVCRGAEDVPALRHGAALGLLIFFAAALKTSYLPFVAAAAAAYYGSRIARYSLGALSAEATAAGVLTLVLAAPWMFVNFEIAHTPWFLVLGSGTLDPIESGSFATVTTYLRETVRLLALFALPVVLVIGLWRNLEWRPSRRILSLLLGGALAFVLVSQIKFSVAGYRHGEIGAVSLLLFILTQSAPLIRGAILKSSVALTIVLAASDIALDHKNGELALETYPIRNGVLFTTISGMRQEQWRDEVLARRSYTEMQRAVPSGASLVAMIARPYLLDQRRNTVYVMDWPMMAGSIPRPTNPDPTLWMRYFRALGIHYAAFSYADPANLSDSDVRNDMTLAASRSRYSAFEVALDARTLTMRQMILAIEHQRGAIWKDRRNFVVRF